MREEGGRALSSTCRSSLLLFISVLLCRTLDLWGLQITEHGEKDHAELDVLLMYVLFMTWFLKGSLDSSRFFSSWKYYVEKYKVFFYMLREVGDRSGLVMADLQVTTCWCGENLWTPTTPWVYSYTQRATNNLNINLSVITVFNVKKW